MDISKTVLSLIADTLDIPQEGLTRESKLDDIAQDSIKLFELLSVFERKFDRSVFYDDIVHIETVGDILDYVEKVTAPEAFGERSQ